MAKKLIRFPGQASRWLLRLIGVMVTFVFTFFVYTSGQVMQSAGLGKSNAKFGLSSVAAPIDSIMTSYGIIGPMYGIAEYGIPWANFSIKGKIRAEGSGVGIPNIKVSATDTLNKIVIDSAITKADGSFSMTFMQSPAFNTWLLDIRDVDESQNGTFERKDTLITIPQDSLKGGSGFYEGAGSADIELFLNSKSSAIIPDGSAAKVQPNVMVSFAKNGAIDLRYRLAAQGRVAIFLFSANGKLIREISDTRESSGDHNFQLASTGLTPGAYFLKLQTAMHSAITKVLIAR